MPRASVMYTAKNGLGDSLSGVVTDRPSIASFAIPVVATNLANASPPRSYALRPVLKSIAVSEYPAITMSRFFLVMSLSTELWRPLLTEGLKPFVPILGEIEKEGHVTFGVEAVGERHVHTPVDDGFRHHDGDRCVIADALGDLARLLQRFTLLRDVVEDAISLGFGSGDP